MPIPKPHELGLPEKFDKWRSNQEEVIDLILKSDKRAISVCAPTGFGKTAAYVAAALLSKKPTCFVTQSKALQDQILCVGPDTKILTGDLRWLPASMLAAGDVVLGFDEYPSPNRRMFRKSSIDSIAYVRKPAWKLTLMDGTSIICSSEHSWLTRTLGKTSRWMSTADLRAGYSGRCGHHLTKLFDVWSHEKDWDSGYLASAFDGEGHLHQSLSSHKEAPNGVDVNLSFAQVNNEMLAGVIQSLNRKGYPHAVAWDKRGDSNPKHKNCCRLTLSGRKATLRFLGEIRPLRLLPTLKLDMLGMMNPVHPVRIIRKEFLGLQDLLAIQTSTHTYIAEGYASHNCDFESVGMVDIRGRNNYACDFKEGMTCEDGFASRCPYKGTIGCPASQAEMRAAVSPLVVTNYAKWTRAKKFGQGMQHFQQVVFDEAHEAPQALAAAMQVVLHYKEIEDGLKIDFPKEDTIMMETWKTWAQTHRPIAEAAMAAAGARITGLSDPKPAWVKHFVHMRNLSRKLATLATCRAQDWIAEEIEQGWQFDPIRPGRYGEMSLMFKLPKIIMVSATLRPKTMFMIGLAKHDFAFKEFNSDFDPKRCPIYYVPTMRVDSRAESLAYLWARLDQVASKRRDRNGIIHTVSYQRREDILACSRFTDSMIFNPKGDPTSETIEKFRGTYPGAILVSPSVEAGYDFAFKAAEWQVLCKIPFEPPSRIVKAREQDDPEYRSYQAMQRMVQSFGRIMRDKEDQGESFIFDQHLDWFLPRYGHLGPRWFHAFFDRRDVLPQPPRRLE